MKRRFGVVMAELKHSSICLNMAQIGNIAPPAAKNDVSRERRTAVSSGMLRSWSFLALAVLWTVAACSDDDAQAAATSSETTASGSGSGSSSGAPTGDPTTAMATTAASMDDTTGGSLGPDATDGTSSGTDAGSSTAGDTVGADEGGGCHPAGFRCDIASCCADCCSMACTAFVCTDPEGSSSD